MSKGFDFNRMTIIIAVLEKRADLFFGALDVYMNVVGGFRIDETAGDLAVALCLYSSIVDKPVDKKTIAIGEIGLGGEIRAVSNIIQRVREAERMGFSTCIVPKQSLPALRESGVKIRIIGVSDINQAFSFFNRK